MNSEKLLSRHALANGLFLEFYDLSQPLVGDRCQVVLEIRVAVPVTAAALPPELRPQIGEIISTLGETPVFTKQEVRNFITNLEAPALLQQMEESLLSSLTGYLSRPDFPGRFIRKEYADHQERQRQRRLININSEE